MGTYLVTWTQEVHAETMEEAATEAYRIQSHQNANDTEYTIQLMIAPKSTE